MEYLEFIRMLGGAVYDVFYCLGLFATTPLSEITNLNGFSYVNPLTDITVTYVDNNLIVNLLSHLGTFFRNNVAFQYEGFEMADLNLLTVIILSIIAVFIIKLVINIIGLFLPD